MSTTPKVVPIATAPSGEAATPPTTTTSTAPPFIPPLPFRNPDRPPAPPQHSTCKAALHQISLGREIQDDGKIGKKNPRQVPLEMWERTLQHLLARGKFFRCGTDLYYLDEVDHILVFLAEKSSPLRLLLLQLGYVPTQQITNSIIAATIDYATKAPERTPHRMSYYAEDEGAAYIRSAENRMLRVAPDFITEVWIGHRDHVLLADDLADWPSLSVLEPLMDEMRSTVGRSCTQLRPDLTMTRLLTARWAEQDSLSAEQAHQLFITRLMFLFFASKYSLWPIILFLGDQDSGKSTACELPLTLLKNDQQAKLKSLPGKEDNLATLLSSASVCFFDNVDGSHLSDPKNSAISDMICHLSTGADVSKRKHYSDGKVHTQPVQNHGFFTARSDPFDRSDVHRRTITLNMKPSEVGTTTPKHELRKAVQVHRDIILAEILLRCQNITRALQAPAHAFTARSEMVDYEVFTYVAAAHEGTLPETETLWDCTRERYLKSITESNPLCYCLMVWLGEKNSAGFLQNVRRRVSAQTLFGELKGLFCDQLRAFPYTTRIGLGRAITKNLPALRTIGFFDPPGRNGRLICFDPSAAILDASEQLYQDFRATFMTSDLTRVARGYRPQRDDLNIDTLEELEDGPSSTKRYN
jgi:hypothetical protein